MKNLFYLLPLVLLLSLSQTFAQTTTYTTKKLAPVARQAVVNLSEIKEDFAPQIQMLEAPSPDGDGYQAYLLRLKRKMAQMYPRGGKATAPASRGQADPPIKGSNFRGNSTDLGAPLDTHLAVSDSGQIIVVVNSNLLVKDLAGAPQYNVSLGSFFASVNPVSYVFDPKAHYDPETDRFFVVALSFSNTASDVLIAFSQTNDATGNWNVYKMDGNPFQNNTFFDYPMLSISPTEIFLTGNSVRLGEPWETGFEETLIYQIDKNSGYNGDSLGLRVWTDVKFGPLPIRNLCPVKGGAGNYGPNHYFLSNRNFDVSNNAFFLVEVTGTADDPTATLEVKPYGANFDYGAPPNAVQPRLNDSLQTNDARVLDAFFWNDEIQFVGNTIDHASGRAAIYHATFSNMSGTPTLEGQVIANDTLEFGYPSISYVGSADSAYGESDAIIFMDITAQTAPPTMGAMYYDNLQQYSDIVFARVGLLSINVLTGTGERWGDYTGNQRKYNDPTGKVWTLGTYGAPLNQQGAWVTEFGRPGPAASIDPPKPAMEITTYPNPAKDYFSVEFQMEHSKDLNISLYDSQGRFVKTFYDFEAARDGLARFTFSTAPLAAGIYFIHIEIDGETTSVGQVFVTK